MRIWEAAGLCVQGWQLLVPFRVVSTLPSHLYLPNRSGLKAQQVPGPDADDVIFASLNSDWWPLCRSVCLCSRLEALAEQAPGSDADDAPSDEGGGDGLPRTASGRVVQSQMTYNRRSTRMQHEIGPVSPSAAVWMWAGAQR